MKHAHIHIIYKYIAINVCECMNTIMSACMSVWCTHLQICISNPFTPSDSVRCLLAAVYIGTHEGVAKIIFLPLLSGV